MHAYKHPQILTNIHTHIYIIRHDHPYYSVLFLNKFLKSYFVSERTGSTPYMSVGKTHTVD